VGASLEKGKAMTTITYNKARIVRLAKGKYLVTLFNDLTIGYTISRLRDAKTFVDECASTTMSSALVFRVLFNR
jgi:DUF1365 family protein